MWPSQVVQTYNKGPKHDRKIDTQLRIIYIDEYKEFLKRDPLHIMTRFVILEKYFLSLSLI